MKTYSPKAKEISRAWYVVDAEGAVLGRLASEVARILRGKHKPTYAPHLDSGDHVIVTNAAGVRLSGEKGSKKVYHRHSQYPGGLREVAYERLARERPERVVEQAVRGMLPRTRLGRQMARKLHVYRGPDHPHGAQRPEALRLGEVPAASPPAAAEERPPTRPSRATERKRETKPGGGSRRKAEPKAERKTGGQARGKTQRTGREG